MPAMKRSLDIMSGAAEHPSSDGSNVTPRADSVDLVGSGKRKAATATRTGQACDRCKVRKIRCDARPGGCSPCLQNKTQCRTTDRITGRATSRGHTESLESENATLRQTVADLQRQLEEHGVEPRVKTRSPLSSQQGVADGCPPASRRNDPHNLANILNPVPDEHPRAASSALPTYKTDSAGDNYLGVSSTNDWPCPTRVSQLSILGMPFDLKDFVAVEDVEFVQPTTYESFIKYAWLDRVTVAPPLPPYAQVRTMSEYWFLLGNSWLPVLHKPQFLDMLDRLYNEPNFTLTKPQTVQLHALLALMLYQFNVRTRTSAEYKWSDHYKYAVGYYAEMWADNSLPAMQALAMIMCVQRGFAQAGALWTVSVQALFKAVEMGLHRSITAWQTPPAHINGHDNEMGKRLFWTILQCHALVGSRLGRPIAVRLDDFDVEIPDAVPDNLPSEEAEPDHRKCSFVASIYSFRYLVVQLKILNSLFTIRPVERDYDQVQQSLLKELEFCRASIPEYLKGPKQDTMAERTVSLYLDYTYNSMKLVLFHPALSRKPEDTIIANDVDTCLVASSGMLANCKELMALRFLDTTWHNTVQLLSAIFTTLFAYTQKKNHITRLDLAVLKADMQSWMEVTDEVGATLGSGKQITNALAKIIKSALGNLQQHLATRDGQTKATKSKSSPPRVHSEGQGQQIPKQNTLVPSILTPPTGMGYDGHSTQPAPSMIVTQQSMPTISYSSAPSFTYPSNAGDLPAYPTAMYDGEYDTGIKTDMTQLAQSALSPSAMTTSQSQASHQSATQAYTDAHAQQQMFFVGGSGGAGALPPHQEPNHSYASALAWRNFAESMNMEIQGVQQAWQPDPLSAVPQREHTHIAGTLQNASGVNMHTAYHVPTPYENVGVPDVGPRVASGVGGVAGVQQGQGQHQQRQRQQQQQHAQQQQQHQQQMGINGHDMNEAMHWPLMGMYVGTTPAQ